MSETLSKVETSPEHQKSVRTIQDAVKDLNVSAAENTLNIIIQLLVTLTTKGTEPLLDKIIGIVGPTPESTQLKIQKLRELINDEETKSEMKVFQENVVNIIVDLLDESMERLEPLIDMVGDRLGNSLRRVLGQMSRIVTEIIDTLVSPIPPLAIFINVTQLIAAVTGIFKIYFTQTLPTVLEAVNTTLELWTGAQLQGLLLKGQALRLYNVFVTQVDKLNDIISNVQNTVGTNANAILDKSLDGAESAVGSVTKAADSVTTQASDAANQAVEKADAVTEQATDAANQVVEKADAVTEQATDAANKAVEKADAVTEQATDAANKAVEKAEEKIPEYPMAEKKDDKKKSKPKKK
jgi:hypothetical protein